MNIASLFVNLGITGAKNAVAGIRTVRNEIRDTATAANQTLSFLQKMYNGVRTLSEGSANAAVELRVLSNAVGVSTENLQKWEYASKLSGAQAGETSSSFKALQNSMLALRATGQAPEYFHQLMSEIGNIDKEFDHSRFFSGEDLNYTMETLRKLAKNSTMDLAMLRRAFQGIGISEGFFEFLRSSDVDLSKISDSLIISKSEISQLEQVKKIWVEIDAVLAKSAANIATVFDKNSVASIKELIVELSNLMRETLNLIKAVGLIEGTASSIRQLTTFIKDPKSTAAQGLRDNRSLTSSMLDPSDLIKAAQESRGKGLLTRSIERTGQFINNNNITINASDNAISIANETLNGIERSMRNTSMEGVN